MSSSGTSAQARRGKAQDLQLLQSDLNISNVGKGSISIGTSVFVISMHLHRVPRIYNQAASSTGHNLATFSAACQPHPRDSLRA